jgi:hypothetical protein
MAARFTRRSPLLRLPDSSPYGRLLALTRRLARAAVLAVTAGVAGAAMGLTF